jgi:hypothetical protein
VGTIVGSVLRRRAGALDPVVFAALGIFVLARLLSSVLTPPLTSPAQIPDLGTYRAFRGFLDFSLTSLTGHAVRPWGVTLWMALWPTNRAVVLAQATLAIIAWGCLAIAFYNAVEHLVLRRLLLVAVLVVGSTASVIGWDSIISSESVSVTAGVLSLAALLSLSRQPSTGRAVRFVLLALWFTMTRPNVFPVLLAWAAVAAVMIVRSSRRTLWGTVAMALVAMCGYTLVYNFNVDGAWRRSAFSFSRTTMAYGYAVGPFDPVAEQVLADLRRSDAPACMLPAHPADVGVQGTFVWLRDTSARCPEMDMWASAHWNTWWLGWLAAHPPAATKIVVRGLASATSASRGGGVLQLRSPPGRPTAQDVSSRAGAALALRGSCAGDAWPAAGTLSATRARTRAVVDRRRGILRDGRRHAVAADTSL